MSDSTRPPSTQFDVKGLHRVRAKAEPVSRRTILPPDLFTRYSDIESWRGVPDRW
jgi:sulfotransferase